MPHNANPYLHVVDQPRMMKGKGAPRSTVFGVIGRTAESGYMKSLGGLVTDSKASAPLKKGTVESSRHINTERHITGPASKTHISGKHHGQIPYPGRYMGDAGHEL